MISESKNNQFEVQDQEGYLVSISDLMMSLLFVFIIILFYFAAQSFKSQQEADKSETIAKKAEQTANQSKTRAKIAEQLANQSEIRAKKAEQLANRAVDKLSNSRGTRTEILKNIRNILLKTNVNILIDEKNGTLRLSEGIISFKHNSVEFTDKNSKKSLLALSEAMAAILPCYLIGEKSKDCPEVRHTIESIFIEGHTDSTGDDDINWIISTQRALVALNFIVDHQPVLKKMKNINGQSVLSVAGYGKFRPLPYNAELTTVEYNKMNRRIDVRLIMTPPENLIAIKGESGWIVKDK